MPTGTHSRSPSPKRNRSRSRSRSRSYDSYDSYTDDYSDSVYSDDDRSRGRTAKDKAATSSTSESTSLGRESTSTGLCNPGQVELNEQLGPGSEQLSQNELSPTHSEGNTSEQDKPFTQKVQITYSLDKDVSGDEEQDSDTMSGSDLSDSETETEASSISSESDSGSDFGKLTVERQNSKELCLAVYGQKINFTDVPDPSIHSSNSNEIDAVRHENGQEDDEEKDDNNSIDVTLIEQTEKENDSKEPKKYGFDIMSLDQDQDQTESPEFAYNLCEIDSSSPFLPTLKQSDSTGSTTADDACVNSQHNETEPYQNNNNTDPIDPDKPGVVFNNLAANSASDPAIRVTERPLPLFEKMELGDSVRVGGKKGKRSPLDWLYKSVPKTKRDCTFSDAFLGGDNYTWANAGLHSIPANFCVMESELGQALPDIFFHSQSLQRKKPPVGKTTTSKGKSPPKKPGAGRGKAVSKEQDYVARRVMSARRLKINDLRNENEDMKQQLADLMRENKLLARTATLQDRKLHQYEDQEGEMPRIISKHNEELRTAKEQIRRQKEKLSKSDGRLKESEDELDRTKRLLKKMKGLVDDKQLDERDNLSRKLSSVEADLEEKDHRVKNLERHVENLQKNHKHELGIERARYKELQKEVQGLRDTSSQLSADLKDARRDLDVQNIYANRARGGRSSTRNSTLSSPAPSQKGLAHHRKNSDPPGMTPREKAKQMELQRRLQDKKLREERQGRVLAEESYHPEPPQEPSRRGQPQTLDDKPGNDWWEQMQKQKQHDENGYRREPKREAPVEEPEEEDWRQSRERLKHEADQRAREQREMREREERDEQERIEQQRRRQREEQERGEREERERRERERREREDRERREREDVARRAQEERDRLENDERERERNRQKNSLLAKMAALEKKKEDNSLISDPFAPQQKPVKKVDEVFDDPFAVPTSRKETKRSDKIQPSPTRRRGSGANYSFGKPIENLHNGKPAYEDVSVPVLERNKRRNNGIFDDDDFSYQPSFGSANRNSAGKGKVGGGGLSNADKAKQKDSLMSDLFGSSAAKSPPTNKFSGDDDDIFGTNNKKNSSSNRRNTNNNDLDFFGSSDPPPKNNSHLLPRRGRQPTTTFTSPAINAVDNFDDDIEEVVL